MLQCSRGLIPTALITHLHWDLEPGIVQIA